MSMNDDAGWTVSRTETHLSVTHEHEGKQIAATFPEDAVHGRRNAECSLCGAVLAVD
jgi:hypothetical protein